MYLQGNTELQLKSSYDFFTVEGIEKYMFKNKQDMTEREIKGALRNILKTIDTSQIHGGEALAMKSKRIALCWDKIQCRRSGCSWFV